MNILLAIEGAISQGVLWGLMTLGVYITFKILNFADMTVDGSFALGGAVSAILIVKGMNPWLSLIPAILTGMVAGGITGILHTKIKIPEILAGILTMIALYSINIRIMGQANTSLLGESTVISILNGMIGASTNTLALVIGVIVSIIVIAILYWFFGTEVGSALRATGNNEYMVRALGANTDVMKIIGLMLGNGLVALSGAFVAQSQGYADVGMGQGTIVIGLASIIIGEVVFGNRFNFAYKLAAVVGGSIIYRIIIAVVLQLGMKSTDLKLLTAIIVAFALAMPVVSKKVRYTLCVLLVAFMILVTKQIVPILLIVLALIIVKLISSVICKVFQKDESKQEVKGA
ncbi:MAG: ABC transporter permease [Cellulosilyticum sp.]|nr:ABC transporter permease [Cellulosilyticum sp.]MEE1072717.1 ABC transporter permease [Cellulosilyticum sp.]